MEMNEVVIVGGGPVGSFMAVLVSQLGVPVTVYEKRHSYTRTINVKIKTNFFKEVQVVCDTMGIASTFFSELNNKLEKQRKKIPIKTLEAKLKQEAEAEGAKYIVEEIKSFGVVYDRHAASSPLILDCTGKNSILRTTTFGDDTTNLTETLLESIMYVNLTADVLTTGISLYPAMKNVNNIRLAQLLTSQKEDGTKTVTIVACISKSLANVFDSHYQDTNRKPIKPFCNSSKEIPKEIFQAISALISPLMLQDNVINLDSVEVKKINVSCGYAKQRSGGPLVCLGDAAIYLAYFQSLNIGLKHALDFFNLLTEYCKTRGVVTNPMVFSGLSFNRPKYRDEYIIKEFGKRNPTLNPVRVEKTCKPNVFMVVTKVLWFGCYSYDMSFSTTRQLTSSFGIYESQIPKELKKLNDILQSYASQDDHLSKIKKQFDDDVKTMKTGVVSMPVGVEPTIRRDTYMIITKGVWYGCFRYDIALHSVARITNVSGVRRSEIKGVLAILNEELASWDELLIRFESVRLSDIQKEIASNTTTQFQHNLTANLISLNSQTGLKVYEMFSHLCNGYAIYPDDTEFFNKCLVIVQEHESKSNGKSPVPGNSTLTAVRDLAQMAQNEVKSDVLVPLLTYPAPKLEAVQQLVRERKASLNRSPFRNGEIKLHFALNCISHLL